MNFVKSRLAYAAIVLLSAAAVPAVVSPAVAQSSQVKQVVNGRAITSGDVQKRSAFLRLQRRGGGQQAALNDLIDQVLRSQEMERLGVRINAQQVDEAYARFAKSNNLSSAQMTSILSQSGVTVEHFKEYIRVQMGWGQALEARARAEGGGGADQAALRELAKRGGTKPSATEYMLQQFVFVVPERDRGRIMGRRKNEANAMRGRINGCENNKQLAATVLDVTVRDLGRVLEPELPPDWEKQVKAARTGGPTAIRETPRGVEFLVICSAREVDDDRVAELTFQKERLEKQGDGAAEALNKKYTEELKKRAQMSAR